MKSLKTLFAFSCLTIFIITSPLFSADYRHWEPKDGIPVRLGINLQWNGSNGSDNQGNICVVWSDSREGDFDIWGQVITSNGEKLWGENGKIISGGNKRQGLPDVISDGNGNWIISWIDYRNSSPYDESGDVYIQKVDANGDPLWASEGVILCNDESRQYNVELISDGNGGALAYWSDYRNLNFDIFGQHIDQNGNTLWQANGLMVAGGLGDQGRYYPGHISAVSDNSGGMIITWSDSRNPIDINLYCNLVTSEGELAWADSSGLPLCTVFGEQRYVQVVSDGNTGAFFAWSDTRNYSETGRDLYGQYILNDGTVVWDDDGEVLSNSTNNLVNIKLAGSVNAAIMAWERINTTGDETDLYVQKITNDNGSPLLHWGTAGDELDGLTICDAVGYQHHLSISLDENDGAYISWLDNRSTESYYEALYGLHITSEGSIDWGDQNGLLICESMIGIQENNINLFNSQRAGYFWLDNRKGYSNIQYQILNLNGSEVLEENGEQLNFGIGNSGYYPEIVESENSYAFIVWTDTRFGPLGTYPFMQRVDVITGEQFEEYNGVQLLPGYPYGETDTLDINIDDLVSVSDGNGGLFTACRTRLDRYEVFVTVQKTDNQGNILWGDRGIIAAPDIEITMHEQSNPLIVATDDGGLVVFYNQLTEDYYESLRVQKLNSDGTGMWTSEDGSGKIISTGFDDCRIIAADRFSDGSVLILFFKQMEKVLYGQKILADGELGWEEPIVLDAQVTGGLDAKTGVINNGILVIWEHYFDQVQSNSIRGRIINSDGTLHENEVVLSEGNTPMSPGLLIEDDCFWITWQDMQNQQYQDIYVQKYSFDCIPQFQPEDGLRIGSENTYQSNPQIISDSNNGVYIAWDEENESYDYNIMFTHLGTDGNLINDNYDQEGLPVANGDYIQSGINISPDGEGGFFAVWQDIQVIDKDHFANIYMQRINDWLVSVGNSPDLTPKGWSLENAYPNPFNPSTKIAFNVGATSDVTLTVFDILGREVIKLVDGRCETGNHIIHWNGKNSMGQPIASGTYFYRLEAEDVRLTKKMVLMK